MTLEDEFSRGSTGGGSDDDGGSSRRRASPVRGALELGALMARVGWPEPGEWHFLDNDVATVSKYKRRRGQESADAEPVAYPWIVVEPPMLLRVWASPRTRQDSYEGVGHDAHPDGHEATCGINCDGTVCTPPDRLDQPIFRDARYSCVEPEETWADIQTACDVPKPRRPENRRRRKR